MIRNSTPIPLPRERTSNNQGIVRITKLPKVLGLNYLKSLQLLVPGGLPKWGLFPEMGLDSYERMLPIFCTHARIPG